MYHRYRVHGKFSFEITTCLAKKLPFFFFAHSQVLNYSLILVSSHYSVINKVNEQYQKFV